MELSAPTRLSAEDDGPGEAPAPGAVRRTLALRLAQRGRLRELRAERLARLRAPAPAPGGTVPKGAAPPPEAPPAPALPASPSAPPAASLPASLATPPEAAPAGTAGDVAPLPRRKVAEEDAVAALEEFLRALTGGLGDPLPPATALLPSPAEPAAVLPFQRRETADAAPERDRAAATGANPRPVPPDPTVTAEPFPAAPLPEPDAAPLAAALSAAGAPASPPASPPVMPSPMPSLMPAITGLEQLPGAGPGLVWALGRAGVGSLGDLAALDPEALAERLGPIGRLVPAARWIAAARAAEAS